MSRMMPAPSDARSFTSYVSSGQREEDLQRQAGVVNETAYRQFLQHNFNQVAQQFFAPPPSMEALVPTTRIPRSG
jgi:hypothetical protein